MTKRRTPLRGKRNKKFRKTEEAIIEALLASKEMPSAGVLARKAKISRSTLYRHHRAVPGIVPDYEKEILAKYRRAVRRISKQKGISLKSIYLRMLIFVINNRRVFEILFRYSGDRVVERMVLMMREKVVKTSYLTGEMKMVMRIYAKEVAGVIEGWGEKGFSEGEMGRVLKDVMYLTETIKRRLGPLAK